LCILTDVAYTLFQASDASLGLLWKFDRKDRIEAISTIDYDRLIKEVRPLALAGGQNREVR